MGGASTVQSGDADTIEFDLLGNAIDFLLHGVEHWLAEQGSQARRCKYAIHHVASAFELLLKERLRRASPWLVFSNPQSGRTVNWREAIRRLEQLPDVDLPDDLFECLSHLYGSRNQVHHWEVAIETGLAEKRLRQIVALAMEFSYLELSVDLMDEMEPQDWRRLADFAEFRQRRVALIQPKRNVGTVRSGEGLGDGPDGAVP